MDLGINSAVYVVVLSQPMNFPLSVSPNKKMGDHTRQRKMMDGNRTHDIGLITVALVTELRSRGGGFDSHRGIKFFSLFASRGLSFPY